MTNRRIRVHCVDDHRILREGLELIIGQQPDMKLTGSAETGEEAVELFRRNRPDVTIMDLRLRGMSGIEAIRAIRRLDPNARIVVLTMYEGDEDIHRALEAGAATYLLKDTISEDLIRVVREVHSGKRPLATPAVASRLAERASQPTLTTREVEVMTLVAQGMRNKEIAAALACREETVHVHLKNIYSKLNVNDRTAAVTVALRRGIVHVA